MSSINALFLITHLNELQAKLGYPAFTSKCSIYDTLCLSSLTQTFATTVIPGGTGYGIESLDPMMLDTISAEKDGLYFELSDIEIGGFKHTLVDKVQFNKDQRKSNLKLRIPTLTMFCNYTTKGFLHSMPFNGDGKLIFKLFDTEFEITMNYDLAKGNDGKEHIKYLTNFTYWYDMRYAESFIQNVNKGDPIKATEAQKVLRREYKILWQHYGRRVLDKVAERIVETVRKVLLIVPAEHILSDYN